MLPELRTHPEDSLKALPGWQLSCFPRNCPRLLRTDDRERTALIAARRNVDVVREDAVRERQVPVAGEPERPMLRASEFDAVENEFARAERRLEHILQGASTVEHGAARRRPCVCGDLRPSEAAADGERLRGGDRRRERVVARLEENFIPFGFSRAARRAVNRTRKRDRRAPARARAVVRSFWRHIPRRGLRTACKTNHRCAKRKRFHRHRQTFVE